MAGKFGNRLLDHLGRLGRRQRLLSDDNPEAKRSSKCGNAGNDEERPGQHATGPGHRATSLLLHIEPSAVH